MTLKEFKEQVNWFDEAYDEMEVRICSYHSEVAMYEPVTVKVNNKSGEIEIELQLAD